MKLSLMVLLLYSGYILSMDLQPESFFSGLTRRQKECLEKLARVSSCKVDILQSMVILVNPPLYRHKDVEVKMLLTQALAGLVMRYEQDELNQNCIPMAQFLLQEGADPCGNATFFESLSFKEGGPLPGKKSRTEASYKSTPLEEARGELKEYLKNYRSNSNK